MPHPQIHQLIHRKLHHKRITAFIAAGNEKPKPHKWVKSVGESLAAVELFCQNSVANLCG